MNAAQVVLSLMKWPPTNIILGFMSDMSKKKTHHFRKTGWTPLISWNVFETFRVWKPSQSRTSPALAHRYHRSGLASILRRVGLCPASRCNSVAKRFSREMRKPFPVTWVKQCRIMINEYKWCKRLLNHHTPIYFDGLCRLYQPFISILYYVICISAAKFGDGSLYDITVRMASAPDLTGEQTWFSERKS